MSIERKGNVMKMALHGFDHTIVLVNAIEAAAKSYTELGFNVIDRPDATHGDTSMRIICLADGSYIELIAFNDPTVPSTHRWFPLLANGPGWVDYSVHCESVEPVAEALTAAGLPLTGPRSGGKALVDGRAWKVGVVEAGFGVGSPAMPFFLEDLAPRANRVPFEGDTRLATVGVTLVTDDIARTGAELAVVFGAGMTVTPRVDGATAALMFAVSDRWLELLEAGAGESPLSQHLKARGEGVYEVTLGKQGVTRPGEGDLLPLEKTGAARLRVQNVDS